MKKTTLVLFAIITMALVNCPQPSSGGSNAEPVTPQNPALIPEAQKWQYIQENLAAGVELSAERPYPGVLSEKEVLLKAVDYAIGEGAGDPSYYLYEITPELLTAKIAKPVLVHNLYEGAANEYFLTAVDDEGTVWLQVLVNSSADAGQEGFEKLRIFSMLNDPQYSYHMITKAEAVNLFASAFAGKQISEPVLISGLLLNNYISPPIGETLWYTTVRNSASDTNYEEYILQPGVIGWQNISGGISNLAALNDYYACGSYLNWNRMAKLDTPLRILDIIEAGRNASGELKFAPITTPNVKFTPVPLQ
jgi:hypothetical protein